jgi:hypothetical protein
VRTTLFFVLLMPVAFAQNQSADQVPPPSTANNQSPQPSGPLSAPAVTGPLQAAPPTIFDGGPFGKIAANGTLSNLGLWQSRMRSVVSGCVRLPPMTPLT